MVQIHQINLKKKKKKGKKKKWSHTIPLHNPRTNYITYFIKAIIFSNELLLETSESSLCTCSWMQKSTALETYLEKNIAEMQ
jgi:hypothetical protein